MAIRNWENTKNCELKYHSLKPHSLPSQFKKFQKMGKGDIKSKKGKLSNGSFGKSRKRNETMPKKDFTAVAVEAADKPKKAAAASKPKAKKA